MKSEYYVYIVAFPIWPDCHYSWNHASKYQWTRTHSWKQSMRSRHSDVTYTLRQLGAHIHYTTVYSPTMFTADSERIVWWLVGGTGELRQWSLRRKLLAMMWLKKLCSISPRLRVSSYYGPFYGFYITGMLILSVGRYFYEGITLIMSHNSC